MSPGTRLKEKALITRIEHLAGLDTVEEAVAAMNATIAALGERLRETERRALADALPGHLGGRLRHRKHRGAFDIAEFYDRIHRREGVHLGFAREHAQVVCRVLGEILPEEVLRILDDALPKPFAELFRSPPEGEAPPEYRLAHGPQHHTLATGSPGSSHPLSESHPPKASD